MNEKVDLKVCAVCSDKALGYNFNVITCESCKAFFRRNALLTKNFKCPFSNKCEITPVTRRFCQKCRLEKCFNIGMRKDLIMSAEDKVLKKKKIQDNKATKRQHSSGFKSGFKKMKKEDPIRTKMNAEPNQCSSSGSSSPVFDNTNQCMIRSILNPSPESELSNCDRTFGVWKFKSNNNDINCNYNESRKENLIKDKTKVVLEEVQRLPIEPNSIESILCEAIKLEYEAYTSLAQTYNNSRELNDAERAKLNELIVANKALLTPVDDDFSKFIPEDCRHSMTENALLSDPALVDVINLTAIAIRRLIKMAKKINAFKNMCQEDQVALLKGGCTEMMILRSAMNYDSSKQSWKIPHIKESLSSLKTDVLKQARGNIYQEHEKFIKTFDPKWRSDENIVLILCAITLFTPDRPRVLHQDVIKLEQNSYYYLLRRYLESVYPGCEAKSTFLKLIQKISELHKVNEEVINCYLDVNPSEVEPLLIEIFDLKH